MLFRILIFLYFLNVSASVDYYELLGVSKDADARDIRKAFKKLALQYHPDKNQEKDANEKFISMKKAYEVLKDENLRKTYDDHGEEGLKDDFKKSSTSGFHSWSYYHESFGIYDDDPKIVTLSYTDFERLVLDSTEMWFVNFYSPQCSHCHILAPAWRKVSQELQGIIQIGAVNCEDDWLLCRRQNVFSYPSLILYDSSKKTKYEGFREAEDMVEYVLQQLPHKVIWLSSRNYRKEINAHIVQVAVPQPWLVAFCKPGFECVSKDDLKKLAIILEHLVHVAEIFDTENSTVCQWLSCESPIAYFGNMSAIKKDGLQKKIINDSEVSDIVTTVLRLLPELEGISFTKLKHIKEGFSLFVPWLVIFTEEVSSTENIIQMKRLKSLLPYMNIRQYNCYINNSAVCEALYIVKFPTLILFKRDGTHEFYYGRFTAYDISRFALEAFESQVSTLNSASFKEINLSPQPWVIDFFSPLCPPCIQFLSSFRKASKEKGHLVKFGVIDCSVHKHICNSNNINSYPSAILFNQGVSHKYYGTHNEHELAWFIEDILNPIVVELLPSTLHDVIKNKDVHDTWVVDFFAPWCGPCQQLYPQWRKMARMLQDFPHVHVGEIDCEIHSAFCTASGIKSYPTIRLFPRGSFSTEKFFTYNEWSRDATSLQAWVYDFFPSNVPVLSDIDFQNMLKDTSPWVIDFFTSWCKHCKNFAPEFEKIAKRLEGRVKAGKVNCDVFSTVCSLASITAYPTTVFYEGRTGFNPQNPVGEEIHPHSFHNVISFLESKLGLNFKANVPLRDEL